jgi:hypothetical protein
MTKFLAIIILMGHVKKEELEITAALQFLASQ